ncbi:MAG: CusA/CzcA family heavy metal efflux RND transporter [Bacteroidetes bacterium]|nr:MAG: CusA/CzcA family heavy metal efflux RND transporter [Bacteroidota bacterium]
MLNKIIEFSIKNKLIIGLFVIGLIIYGSFQITKLPIDAVPDITDNQVQVITIAPSFGATDIERLITFPIEQANSNIDGIKEIRSFSRFGLSLVTIVFTDKTDIYWARQQVAERLAQVQSQIPQGIGTPELGPISTGLGEIYQYVIRPEPGFENKYNETDLRTIQDWIVRRQLLGVKGVAEVSSFGGKVKQYEIAVDANRLQAFNININDVFSAVEKNNQNTGGAYIEKGPTVLFIRSEGLIGSKEDIENICIENAEGEMPLFIRDVAEVKIGHATRFGAMCYNDEGEVAGAIVMMLKGGNSNEVIKNVKDRIAQIQKTLPEGVIIEPFLDRTKMVNNAIFTVEKNLLEGALIVVFILVLFLGNFRAGFLVASVIPLSMLFAVCMMNAFGVSGNLMSLGALDFGLIVDGAVIIVEAVMHQLAHIKRPGLSDKLEQHEMDSKVKDSASKMMNSAVFGQIIILIVYLPILTLQGIEGKMFKPMAQTVAFALLGAFILSLTYIPMMSALVLSKKVKHAPNMSDKVMFRIEMFFQKTLSGVLNFPKAVLSIVLILFVLAIFTLSRMGGEFIPALEEGDFAVDTRVLTGSNLTTTIEATQKAAHILKTQFPEVEKVVTKIGSGEVPTDPMPMEASDMMVILKPKKEWTSAKTFNELAEKMSKALESVPGITAGFQYPVQMRFNELMTGARQDVVCKIFGENLDSLAVYAEKLGKIASKVEGSQNLFVEPVTGIPQIIIEFNRASVAQYKLNISDINKIINTAFAGQVSGLVFEGERRFDLVVRLKDEKRRSLRDVQNLLIPTPQGSQIPLGQLATVKLQDGPNQIQREDAKRRIVVGFNVRGRDVQSIVNELQEKADKQLNLPTGYFITYGGAFENLNAAKNRLMIAVPISLLLIFILLYFAFSSIRHGLLIYTAIPLSTIGGIFFLAMRGMPFSISAGVGFIALFGVAVLNGIVLVAEFNRLKKVGSQDLRRIVLMGTKIRLRPVLMTAFVASLGFLPMALSNGAGAEVQKPLATVVIGGLLIATFLTLFVLPILYIMFEKGGRLNVSAKSLMVAFLFSFSILTADAQTPISLQASIDTALKSNLLIKNEILKEEYHKKLRNSGISIPHTNVAFEGGEINSAYTDSRFSIVQSFSFPTVYSRQRKVHTEEWKLAMFSTDLKEAEIKRAVAQKFSSILLLKEKEKLLTEADSNFSAFLVKANARFQSGESNILEKATAESQQAQVRLQLRSLQQELELNRLEFQLLLNTETILDPTSDVLRFSSLIISDSLDVNTHPILKLSDQQKSLAKGITRLERAKLIPEISLGYFNTSMRGTGADDIYYPRESRFSSVEIGVGIPLFFGSQKSKIRASRVNELIADNNHRMQVQNLRKEYQAALLQYKSSLAKVNYFEESGMLNSKLISTTASQQFSSGEINYLDWVLLNNQAYSIQNDYLESLNLLNESIILINYLTSKQ